MPRRYGSTKSIHVPKFVKSVTNMSGWKVSMNESSAFIHTFVDTEKRNKSTDFCKKKIEDVLLNAQEYFLMSF